jgi:hypothetical protein
MTDSDLLDSSSCKGLPPPAFPFPPNIELLFSIKPKKARFNLCNSPKSTLTKRITKQPWRSTPEAFMEFLLIPRQPNPEVLIRKIKSIKRPEKGDCSKSINTLHSSMRIVFWNYNLGLARKCKVFFQEKVFTLLINTFIYSNNPITTINHNKAKPTRRFFSCRQQM